MQYSNERNHTLELLYDNYEDYYEEEDEEYSDYDSDDGPAPCLPIEGLEEGEEVDLTKVHSSTFHAHGLDMLSRYMYSVRLHIVVAIAGTRDGGRVPAASALPGPPTPQGLRCA